MPEVVVAVRVDILLLVVQVDPAAGLRERPVRVEVVAVDHTMAPHAARVAAWEFLDWVPMGQVAVQHLVDTSLATAVAAVVVDKWALEEILEVEVQALVEVVEVVD